jgi:outer membrane protein OmpA-like peptidoglycan-associated protein
MKKLFLMLAVAALSAQTMSAQTVEESKNFDNWYIGINGGVQAPAKNFKVLKNLNPAVGLRLGRWFTPAVGFAIEGQTFLGDKPVDSDGTFKGLNLEAMGTLNFSNWLGGYPGEPRSFEVIGLLGIGWGHAFNRQVSNHDGKNSITSKVAADFAFNLGAAKAVQLYIEPYIMYGLTTQRHSEFNLNSAVIGGLVGLNYKFGNSNGTHNFKIAELRDQAEIDGLNSKINELRANLNDKDAVISAKDGQIRDLKAALDACNNRPVEPVYVKPATATNLQPTVLFRKGKSTIDAAQYAPIELIASYMKNHPEAKVEIKGYASPEGSLELNQKLSEDRANAVKTALIKKYKIAADRLTAIGCGPTDQLFEEIEFNRVATFNDMAK